ncbi:MAG TPA: crosslink repair DNA glycosylase YcaQ family protein [Segeticoccus sp.]|uniref:helix-turn-helix transcriptional regulator n=1 Tax=Segeticoccus sp. TaxID=2706531 RepID=UPI002D7E49EB|nr:crosslink repair DNA glycosylase YcaQ family protein [Segeticoccus sp.]HET8600235.1 crosslink repair DNA glycosylase YcaQ family protein [Segeticoccus sp.]
MSERLEERTRDRVRSAVSEHGPVSAAAIAESLGLTPAAVRRHLDALAEEGTIEEHELASGPRGRGRPARAYVLSEAGHRSMQSTYDGVATAALRFLAQRAGEDAVEAFARERVAELEERLAAALADVEDTPDARTRALVRALSEEGYAASARPVGQGTPLTGVQLCQGHCPIKDVATQFPQFCEAETDALSRLLGVHVQRLATLAHGDHVCTTFVPTPVVTSSTRAGARPTTAPQTTPAQSTAQTLHETTHKERASR